MHEGDGFSAKTLLSGRAMVRPASSVKWKTPLDFFLTLNGPSPLGSRGYLFYLIHDGISRTELRSQGETIPAKINKSVACSRRSDRRDIAKRCEQKKKTTGWGGGDSRTPGIA